MCVCVCFCVKSTRVIGKVGYDDQSSGGGRVYMVFEHGLRGHFAYQYVGF